MAIGAKTLLLADVGGTNTRVAVVREGALADMRHFDNASFSNVYDLLQHYVTAAGVDQVHACSVAMAGPVRGGQGRLTNRDWHITSDGLRDAFTGAHSVLLNDLTALGYAVQTLPAQNVKVMDHPVSAAPNGQSLVVGMGTGFNLCPVLSGSGGQVHCLEVEMGHATLPATLKDALAQHLRGSAAQFVTLEDLFSGMGLAQFHTVRTGEAISAKDIVQSSGTGNQSAHETLDIYTTLLGLLCHELAFQYMPMDGIYFAGSVARGVLTPQYQANLDVGGASVGKLGNLASAIPKIVILEDAAALHGCRVALELSGYY